MLSFKTHQIRLSMTKRVQAAMPSQAIQEAAPTHMTIKCARSCMTRLSSNQSHPEHSAPDAVHVAAGRAQRHTHAS